MPDPMDQNNPPSTPAPTLPDPQAMVDAALSPTPEAPAPTTTTTTTTTEPVTPPTMAAVPPMPEPVAPTLPPAPDPMPTMAPAPATTSVAMGDDTPLAFVTPPPTTGTTTTTTTTSTTQPVDGAAPLPPVPPAPTGSEMPKKKGKAGKIVGLLLGFLTLLGVGGGGAYWYYYDYRTLPTIAPVDVAGEADCNGCDGGHQLVWRNGQCVWRARLCEGEDDGSGGASGPSNGVNNSGVTNRADCDGCGTDGYAWVWRNGACKKGNVKCDVSGGNYVAPKPEEVAPSANNTCGTGYAYCGGAIDKCVSHGALSEAGGGCNKYGEVVYGITSNYNVQCIPAPAGYDVDANNDGKSDAWVPPPGVYSNGPVGQVDGKGVYDQVAEQCATTGSQPGGFGTGSFICAPGVSGACTSLNGKPFTGNLSCFCGTVQVDDGSQHTTYTNSCGCNEEENPPASEPPASAPPTAPVMACTGLTYTPTTAPVIGSVLTFTCAGSITPTTAGTLSYKFRSSINNAAPTLLANTTPTTARLTIAACGDYKVECQTCATIAGVLTCDPVWTGATQ